MATFSALFLQLCHQHERELARHLARALHVDEQTAFSAVAAFTLPADRPEAPDAAPAGATPAPDTSDERDADDAPLPRFWAPEKKVEWRDAEFEAKGHDEPEIVIYTFYSPQCHAVFGDAAKRAASALNCVYRSRLSFGPGWTFPPARLAPLTQELDRLGLKYSVVEHGAPEAVAAPPVSSPKGGSPGEEGLGEAGPVGRGRAAGDDVASAAEDEESDESGAFDDSEDDAEESEEEEERDAEEEDAEEEDAEDAEEDTDEESEEEESEESDDGSD